MSDDLPTSFPNRNTTPSPALRTLNRTQVNQIVRVSLLAIIIAIVGLVILAAHPAPRVFGYYPGVLNARNIFYGDGDSAVAYITISHAAIVTFPADWGQGDSLCVTVQIDRTAVPGHMDFNDYVPQRHWDDPEHDILTTGFHSIDAKGGDGMTLHLLNNDLAVLISEQTPYRIQWFGQDPVQIPPNQGAAGLMCFNFQFVDGKIPAHLPPFFYVAVGVLNGHVTREPAFYFNNRDSVADSKHPAQTNDLIVPPVAVADYLSSLWLDAPFAVELQQAP